MRAERLRAILEDLPDLAEVTVRVIVGGDLVTDNLNLLDVRVTSGPNGTDAVLIPEDDHYEICEHIDNGLAAYHAIADAEELGNGWLRYTRDEAGNIILDHVDATRVIVVDPPATT